MRAIAAQMMSQANQRSLFKSSIREAKTPSIGLFLNGTSPVIAEQVAATGAYNWLLVDAQHSPLSHQQLDTMLCAINSRQCPSLVRVGGPDDRIGIQQALDLGAYGIMIPTVRTAQDARKVVDAAYFPPLGSRSIAFPIRPQLGRPIPEFLKTVNEEVLVILQIETRESIDNLEEILAVPGVDATFVGPFDLSFCSGYFEKHGFPGGLSSEDMKKTWQDIANRCKAAGVVAGSFAAGLDGCAELIEMGYTLVGPGTEVGMLGAAIEADRSRIEQLTSKSTTR